jgi:hypothetical protein
MKFCVAVIFAYSTLLCDAFVSPRAGFGASSKLEMAVVLPSESSTVGVVGRGFISVLSAKLAAKAGYKTWLLAPPGQRDIIISLLDDDSLNLEIVEATDSDRVGSNMAETDAYIIAVDDDSTMDEGVINYVLNPETSKNVKRVSVMSRNLNGANMGFFVKASKISANAEVWDNSKANDFKKFEDVIKRQTSAVGGDYTIVRAGTLKGGACGEEPILPQYLSRKFYEMTKKDIITWQLLFDCNVRGVKVRKGDVLPGAGNKAIFTATATESCPGDSSRCGIAEALVRSISFENTANMDFGIGTEDGREPPSDEEWQKLLGSL